MSLLDTLIAFYLLTYLPVCTRVRVCATAVGCDSYRFFACCMSTDKVELGVFSAPLSTAIDRCPYAQVSSSRVTRKDVRPHQEK